jgi:anti-sigma B factor antagonist
MTDQYLTATVTAVTGSVSVLTVVGEIDRDSIRVMTEAAEPVLRGDGRRLVIDLSGVTFCDSSGINLMFQLNKHLADRGGALSVAGARDMVLRTLEVVNLHRIIAVHPTVDEAVRAATEG